MSDDVIALLVGECCGGPSHGQRFVVHLERDPVLEVEIPSTYGAVDRYRLRTAHVLNPPRLAPDGVPVSDELYVELSRVAEMDGGSPIVSPYDWVGDA